MCSDVKDFQKQNSWQHTAILPPCTLCDRQYMIKTKKGKCNRIRVFADIVPMTEK